MFHAHGDYPWDNSYWNGIWTYHTKFIPAGAAKLLIEQAIRCSGQADPSDGVKDDAFNTVENFKSSGMLNKAFRVVRSYMDGEIAKVVAVYNHDGVYHLIEAEELAFITLWTMKFADGTSIANESQSMPKYPNEYHLESMRGT